MASKSGSKPSNPRSFLRRGNISSLQNYVIVKVMLKTMWAEKEGPMLLSWRVLFVGGRVVRQGRWEGNEVGLWEDSEVGRWESWEVSEVGRWGRWKGSEVARWESWEGSEVTRWEKWENGEAERWEVPGFIQVWSTQDDSKISCSCF